MVVWRPCRPKLVAQSRRCAAARVTRCCPVPLAAAARTPFGARGFQQQRLQTPDDARVTGPRHYPSLSQTLRNTRGRELLRIVDIAVPNLRHMKEFNVVLKALALDGQWRRTLRLLREMRDVGVEPDLDTYNQVLAAMAKDKQVDKALGILEEMREKTIAPDVLSYSNCVGACKPSEWERTLQIMDSMPSVDLSPDGACFENAAAACEEAGEWERSLSLFTEIAKRELESTSVGHNYALSACRQGKQWKQGFEILAQMAVRNFEPDFRLRQDLEAQSRGLDRAPPPEPSQRSTPSPDNVWQRKQQLRELREQDKRKQEERRLEQERLNREPAPKPYEEDGFMVHGGQDAFANKNAHTMSAIDIASCRKVCQERGYGAFTVWNGQAYFRSESAQQVKDNMKRAAGTTLYVNLQPEPERKAKLKALQDEERRQEQQRRLEQREERQRQKEAEGEIEFPVPPLAAEERGEKRAVEARWDSRPKGVGSSERQPGKPRAKLRSPGSYVLPVFAQHDRSNHAERQALIKVIARVQEASQAQTDDEFERECAEVTGTVRVYASHTPCISCMACFCQFQRLFPKVKLCVDFDDWRDTRRMVEIARREQEYKRKGEEPPNYDCPGLSDMSDEEEFPDDDPPTEPAASQPAT